MTHPRRLLVLTASALLAGFLGSLRADTASFTPTVSNTEVDSPTVSVTSTEFDSPTVTVTSTEVDSPTVSVTSTLTASPTVSATSTEVDSPTVSATPSATASASPSPTDSPSATSTATSSGTVTGTPDVSPTPTYSNSPNYSPTPTSTASQTFTSTVTFSASPTASPTPSVTLTSTASPTPGSGSYTVSVYPSPLVPGNNGYSLRIAYTAGASFSGGSLVIVFPADFGQPGPGNIGFSNSTLNNNFVSLPLTAGNFGPQMLDLTINSLNPGQTVTILYNSQNGGFSLPGTTQTGEAIQVYENPQPGSVGGTGLVPGPAALPVQSATVSPTVTPSSTASPGYTQTPSATPTISPTFTISATVTATPTLTPVGPVRGTVGFYTYPNPFDKRLYSQVTIRFPPTSDNVTITIFNLAGYPVREIPSSDITPSAGLAVWTGEDDNGHPAPGGLYFVRLKTPTNTTVHKMTVYY